jgi:hypothetical protein
MTNYTCTEGTSSKQNHPVYIRIGELTHGEEDGKKNAPEGRITYMRLRSSSSGKSTPEQSRARARCEAEGGDVGEA